MTASVVAVFFGSGAVSAVVGCCVPHVPKPRFSSSSANTRKSRTAALAARTASSDAFSSRSAAMAARSGGAPSQSAVSVKSCASTRRSEESVHRVGACSPFRPRPSVAPKSIANANFSLAVRKRRNIVPANEASPSRAATVEGKFMGVSPPCVCVCVLFGSVLVLVVSHFSAVSAEARVSLSVSSRVSFGFCVESCCFGVSVGGVS
mmetsp:Transcript_9688/g.35960  ORF Transcript_9688/g.35960 Transcript_9688/m.35960 type:complete len:206 (+) Transcript_9688:1148-1765(+)